MSLGIHFDVKLKFFEIFFFDHEASVAGCGPGAYVGLSRVLYPLSEDLLELSISIVVCLFLHLFDRNGKLWQHKQQTLLDSVSRAENCIIKDEIESC